MACGKRPSVATFPKETRNPNFGVKSHVLNVGDAFFKMLSHQAGETKQEDRRDGIPRPPLCDLCVKAARTTRVTFEDKKRDVTAAHIEGLLWATLSLY